MRIVVAVVKREKPVYEASSMTGCTAGSCHTGLIGQHEYGELQLQDKEPEFEHWLDFLLNCAPVFQTHGFGVGLG